MQNSDQSQCWFMIWLNRPKREYRHSKPYSISRTRRLVMHSCPTRHWRRRGRYWSSEDKWCCIWTRCKNSCSWTEGRWKILQRNTKQHWPNWSKPAGANLRFPSIMSTLVITFGFEFFDGSVQSECGASSWYRLMTLLASLYGTCSIMDKLARWTISIRISTWHCWYVALHINGTFE